MNQLYVAVAIPSAIAFLGFVTTIMGFVLGNKRLDDMNARTRELREDMLRGFDKIDDRFDKIDDRFERVEDRFGRVEDRFERIEGRLDLIQKDQREFYATQRVHDEAITTLKGKLK